ncbi:Uu.00g086530.m01.CDS01 [Anthostomella pinea]|uniref:beta-galactosidase n=1 Tax=Anthostomella pinea TaxID=933095 RepID=A0AAI8VMU0_9PEZI|nr:Uu.00g086530.m01.CDS01 [Anthostomella pinea]
MRLFHHLLLAGQLLAAAAQQWPLHDDGLNDIVQWDHYSLIVNGERLFFWSGEFHYWRIPVPELWRDIMEKIKAAGFNAFSIYAHWGWHSAAAGELDFETGAHDFTQIFEIAKELGLYMLVRSGPYINAETTAGGFPGWLLTGDYGTLRNNDTRYTEAWTPYWNSLSTMVAEHSATNGGNVILYQIENEYGEQWTDVDDRTPNETAIAYMELLEAAARSNGVNIPTLANNPNLGSKSWSLDYDVNHVGGDTDIYGLDNYPSCWSCNTDECTSTNGFPPDFTVFDYYTNFQQTAPTQPSILAEFQGGSYNPWGGPQGGCINTTGPDWVNVFYRNNIGNKVTGQNLYMLFGGTSWGGLPMPTVGTSYDYSAPISESRLLTNKYSETKLLSYFVRAAKDLTMVEKAGNGTTNFTGNPDVFSQALRNVDTGSHFYVVKHTNTTLTLYLTFKLNMTTSLGQLEVPQYAPDIVLDGRQAKILVADFAAGDATLVYSTAEIMTVSIQNGKPIIVFWVPTGESGEVYLKDAKRGSITRCDGCANVAFHPASEGLIVSFMQNRGMSVLTFDNGVKAVIMDRTTAYTFWQPTLSTDPHVPLNETLLVRGPYLVRTASVDNGMICLTGDYNDTGEIEVFAPVGHENYRNWNVNSSNMIMFNGKPVAVRPTKYGSLVGSLSASNATTIQSIQALVPSLSDWKVADGLPERFQNYNDSGPGWVLANKNRTLNPWQPQTFPVLYGDEYGFHAQNLLWRGRFSGNATGVFLDVIGGTSSGWSAWLNGVYLGSTLGNASLSETNATLSFGNATKAGENMLFIIQDHMGHDETTGVLNPRGILNATLLSPSGANMTFSSWKVAGKAGGEANIDPIRGPYNEGGLHAERLGWHLPGFNDNAWASGSPEQGLTEAGAKFYRTNMPLDLPEAVDVSMAFELNAPEGSKLRAQLYVNGYMFGKFVPYIGHQIEFPVFPGILNYHGNNTIGLNVWAQDAVGASMIIGVSVLSCRQCKSKKVKCDEKKPCSYCFKRRLPCSLDPQANVTTAIAFPPSSPVTSFFDFTDFALFRHFIKSVGVEHGDDAASATAWCETVPELATQHPYLLHHLLAMSAMHLKLSQPQQTDTLDRISAEHHAQALPLLREALATSGPGNCQALFATAALIIPYSIGNAKDPLSLISDEETQSPPKWLLLIDGCSAITRQNRTTLLASPMRAILGDMSRMNLDDIEDSATGLELVSLKDKLPVCEELRPEFSRVIDTLRYSFTMSDRARDDVQLKSAAWRWIPTLGDIFKEHLGRKHPAALIVMGFWCILMYRFRNKWWLKGRVQPILLAIEGLLPLEHRHLIAMPLEQCGIRQTPSASDVSG